MTADSPAPLPGPLLRQLKSRAQLLAPTVFVGKAGLSADLRRSADEEFARRELVKVKFVACKEEKEALSAQLAADTGSRPVLRVGHVVVLYRRHPDPARRQFEP